MLHLRLTVPSDRVGEVLAHLEANPGVAHLAHLPGASRRPAGDLVLCDIAREEADRTVEWLQDRGIHVDGAITMDSVGAVVSDEAARAEAAAPGHGGDALVWEQLEAAVRDQGALTASLVVLMSVASMIAGVGILLDSPILIIGAMVVGPEYGPVAALCVAAVRGRWSRAGQAATTLAVLVASGAVMVFLLTHALRATGIASDGYELTDRQLTAFIAHPDALAAVVAVLAGVAGMLSLTEGRSGTLVGVLVSVTTIPAIANIGLAAAYGVSHEMWGAAAQLAVNLTGLLLAGVATLAVQARLAASSRRRE